MAGDKKLTVLITANAKQAQKEFGALGQSAGKTEADTKKALRGMRKELVGLGVGGAAAIASFHAFEESAKVGRQTEAVIKSTGNEANVTSGHIGDLATELSKLGGVDDELIQSGENMLLTFTKVRNEAGKGNDIFDQATRAANDYAAATGTDVVNANKMLGKALNDPIKGLTALTRAGVSFTAQQKSQIQAMVKAGDTLGAQKIILAEFNKEYGGSLEANATASGKAQVAMENLGEAVGGILAPGLEAGANALGTVAEGLAELPEPAQQVIVGVAGIGTAALVTIPKAVELAGTLKDGAKAAKEWASEAGSMGKVGAGLGAAAAGVGAFTLTLEALNNATSQRADVKDLTTDLDQLADGSASLSTVADTLGTDIDGLGEAFAKNQESPKDFGELLGYMGTHFKSDTFTTGLQNAQHTIEDLDTALAGMVESGNTKAAATAYGQLAAEMMDQGFTADEVAASLPNYWDQVDRAGRANKDAAGAVNENAGATERASTATHTSTETLKRNADALAKIHDRAEEATSAISKFYDEQTGSVSSQIDAERALDDITAAVKDHGRELSIDTESGRQNREAIIAAKDAAVEYAMAVRDQTGSTAEAVQTMTMYRLRLADTLLQAGYTKNQVAALIDEMGLTPTDVWTQFGSNATEAELKVKDVRKSIDDVPGWKDIYFNALTDEAKWKIAELSKMLTPLGSSVLSGTAGAAVQQSTQGHVGHKALGGRFGAGEWDVVGEHGPELVHWDRGGTVIPATKTKQMLSGTSVNAGSPSYSGGPVVNNWYITETSDAKATAREVAKVINRETRNGRNPLYGGRQKVLK